MGFFSTTVGYFAFSALHLVCFALALAVCGLYGQDLHNANDQDKYMDSKWVYAVVVGSLSAVTCVVWFIPAILRHAGIIGAIWNTILFILWITLFGVFGALYIHENPEGDGNIKRMKSAVWVDLVSALLWLVSAIATTIYWWRHRDVRSQFTGRARV
ncbi:membrane-associating domain-containing protein [Pochonia chlamydosporia 170]|uniref:Membrane-associating domain-containing protein n=1 Tax=Pochonia chlamydosporia 170 TaxID=1380566 RepID=A0A179F530_METCM|nr:membrane-associating domain-containing protein [Pochonia chlamydosporia 170]OAQ60525.1 membrane-associating domain-containing protein [Pochonia chlamydosporia 170]